MTNRLITVLAMGLVECSIAATECSAIERGLACRCYSAVCDVSCVAGYSVEGRPILVRVLGNGSDTILLLAAIHGNEPAGVPLLERLGNYLVEHPGLLHGRRVLLVPVMNPDGLIVGTRYNARGVDLNRNFPATNRADSKRTGTALSEPESQVLTSILEAYRPNRVVTIHQPLSCVDYDGPGQELAQAMASSLALPIKKLGSYPGSLGSFVGLDQGIPIVTLELPREASALDDEVLWTTYGDSLLAAIVFPSAEPSHQIADAGRAPSAGCDCRCTAQSPHTSCTTTCTRRTTKARPVGKLLTAPLRWIRKLSRIER